MTTATKSTVTVNGNKFTVTVEKMRASFADYRVVHEGRTVGYLKAPGWQLETLWSARARGGGWTFMQNGGRAEAIRHILAKDAA